MYTYIYMHFNNSEREVDIFIPKRFLCKWVHVSSPWKGTWVTLYSLWLINFVQLMYSMFKYYGYLTGFATLKHEKFFFAFAPYFWKLEREKGVSWNWFFLIMFPRVKPWHKYNLLGCLLNLINRSFNLSVLLYFHFRFIGMAVGYFFTRTKKKNDSVVQISKY